MLVRESRSRHSAVVQHHWRSALAVGIGSYAALYAANLSAATLAWDPDHSGTSATYNGGTWDTATANWSNGSTDVNYVSASDAVFGGTSTGSASVLLSGPQNANTVAINSTGYGFSGSALTISGTFATASGITVANNVSTTFGNVVNFTNGAGTFANLGLGTGSSATFSGGGTTGGTLKVSNLANSGATNGTLNLNGGTFSTGTLWTQAVVNQGAATVNNIGSSLIGYAGNSTYTLNNASGVFNQNNGSAMFLGRGGTSGTFALQNGSLNLATSVSYISAGFRDSGSTGALNISGGTLSAAANTVFLVDAFNNLAANGYTGSMTVSGGTASVAGITFFGSGTTPATATVFSGTNTATLNVSGGNLYLGAGGLTTSTATSGTRTTAINLSGGTVGASANWSSSMAMTLTNAGGGVTIQAADAAATARDIALSGALSGVGNLTKTGGGTLTLAGLNTYSGTTSNSAGTLSLTGTLGSGLGTAITNAAAFTESSTGTITAASSFTNSSGTATLGAANTYSGGTFINGGTVTLGNALALNAGNVAKVTFGAGSAGVLQLNGNSVTLRSLNTNATVGTPIIENNNATAATLSEAVRSTDATDTYAGVLQNGAAGGTLGLIKSDTGTLILLGNNTFTGGTTLQAGFLVAGNNAALGAGTFGLNGGTIASDSDSRTLGNAVSFNSDSSFGSTSLGATLNKNLKFTGAVNTGGGSKMFTVNNAVTEFSNTISGANTAATLTKAGAGKLIFSGANNYTKATLVNAGTLQGASATAFGASAVTVANTGNTLLVDGPSAINIGGLTGLSIAAGNTLAYSQVGDKLTLASGTFALGNGLTVDLSNAFNALGSYTLVDGSGLLTSTLGTYSFTNVDQTNFSFALAVADGSDADTAADDLVLTVTAVPEPTSLTAIGAGSIALLRRRRVGVVAKSR